MQYSELPICISNLVLRQRAHLLFLDIYIAQAIPLLWVATVPYLNIPTPCRLPGPTVLRHDNRRCEIKYVYVYRPMYISNIGPEYTVTFHTSCETDSRVIKTGPFRSGSTLIRSKKARDLVCSKNRCSKLLSCADCRAWTSKGASTSPFLSSVRIGSLPLITKPRCGYEQPIAS